MAEDPGKQPLNPSAIAISDAAQLLSKVGRRPISTDQLEADIGDGAPTNPDGTVNLVHYAAWLVKSMSRKGDS